MPRARSRSPRYIGIAALIVSSVLLLLALLTIFPAPTYNLWKLRLLVSECGHYLAPLCLLTLLVWRRSMLSRAAAVVAFVAGAILLLPSVRAISVLRTMPEPRPSVLQFIATLYRGPGRQVQPEYLQIDRPNGEHLRFEYFREAGDSIARVHAPPLVVMIHGGSWQGGEPGQLGALTWHLTRKGYAVAAITYRFAPRDTFPAQLDDVRDEVAFLRTRAEVLGFDPNHIAVLGRSAGAQLAMLYAYTTQDPAIRAAISFYGPMDLKWGYDHPSKPHVHDSRRYLRDYLGGTPQQHPARYEAASPITYAKLVKKPTLLLHGSHDDLVSVEQSRRMARALLEAKHPAAFLEMPWATHGCDYIVRGPCYSITTLAVERFLRDVLPP